MLDLKDINNLNSETLLESYKGKNPYIVYMKKKLCEDKKYILTNNQLSYVRKYYNFEPKELNKVIELTNYFSEELKEKYKLKSPPKKILIETLLAESDKAMHVLCKFYQNQKGVKLVWIPKTQLLDDIYYEEINVDVDFDYYQRIDKRGWKAFKHQEEGIKFLLKNKKCILADDMGLGKCLEVDELVYTPNGLIRIGDIKIGDYVIGSNGKKTKVLSVYPQKNKKKIFKITFNDGYSLLVTEDHLWDVMSCNNSNNRNNGRNKRHLLLTTKQMLDGNGEVEIKGSGSNKNRVYKVKTYYKQKNGTLKWQIPLLSEPIHFENKKKLLIDPYLLGVCLGDGHIKEKSVRLEVHKDDFEEIFKGQIIKENKSKPNTRRCTIKVGESIKKLKLNNSRSYNKFIPNVYKYSSIKNRLSILQGLMDTDGHCCKPIDGNFRGTKFCSISEKLVDDVAEIVHSLGGIVKKNSWIPTYTYKNEKKKGKRAYSLYIKLPDGMNPFRLKRKSNLYNSPKKYKVGRYIKSIDYVREGDSVCISVDSDDHLFVAKHGIVTHNTYQSITASLESDANRILVVCPSSLKINWMREIENFTDDVSIINGSHWDPSRFTIINYEILKKFHTIKEKNKEYEDWELRREIVEYNPDIIILDEAHYVKNHKSNRGKIIIDIVKNYGTEKVWLLTGTPIANRPMDYYNLLSIIDSPVTNNWVHFAKTYCEGKRFRKGKKYIWVTKGASNLEELSAKTRKTILRRKKEDVLDLPEKLVTPVYLELKNVDQYKSVWDDYLLKRKEEGKRGNPARDLVEMTLLRTFISMETVPYSIEKAEEALELGKKVIIFCNFNDEMDAFITHFGDKSVCVRGGMSNKQKQISVDKFQEDKNCMVFIGQIKAAGVGLTLTEGEIVIMNSLDWVPGTHEQAEDRAYRIGQNKTVNIYYMLIDKTIDTLIWKILQNKKKIIGTIIGEDEIITEFINETKNES